MITQEAALAFQQSPDYQQAQESYKELLARAATDMEFREKLKTNPHEAIEEWSGEALPESYRNIDFRFVENEGDVTVVLPDPVNHEAELSEEELEAVAGGLIIIVASSTGCAALASAAVSYLTAKL